MLVSFETPISQLQISQTYNDYDYALVHLFEKYPEYLKYFENSVKTRRMYLDNSLFELGSAYDNDKFKHYCKHFGDINSKNFYYIVPDCLNDCQQTIENFIEFSKYPINGGVIGVAQGDDFKSTLDCFFFMKQRCDIVAISFGYNWFEDYGEGDNIHQKRMNARQKFIHELNHFNLLEGVQIHLLGCALPQEFKAYKDIPNIVSIDTSNPIVHGILNIPYSEQGLNTKMDVKLADLIEWDGDFTIALENAKKFKEINL